MAPEVWAAIIAGFVALIGYPTVSFLTGWSERRAKHDAFKLDCYQNFLKSFFELVELGTREAQLAFTHSINIMNLMARSEVLQEVDRLITNYEEESGSEKQQWEIVNRIIYMMRRDLMHSNLDALRDYRFPFIVPDLPEANDDRPRTRRRRRQ